MRQGALRITAAALVVLALALCPVLADCRTSNCSQNNARAAACADVAEPRIPTVMLTFDFIFVPDFPRVEGGQLFCIKWEESEFAFIHSSTAAACVDFLELDCDNAPGPNPADCKWETGNVLPGEFVECSYNFAADTTEGFDCRPHDDLGMLGTLRITNPIVLSVDKVNQDVELSWTGGDGGGVIPAARRFTVLRADDARLQTAGPGMDPIGGAGGTSFTDVGEATPATPSRYYLVRHRQDNEL